MLMLSERQGLTLLCSRSSLAACQSVSDVCIGHALGFRIVFADGALIPCLYDSIAAQAQECHAYNLAI